MIPTGNRVMTLIAVNGCMALSTACAPGATDLSPEDRAAIESLEEAYRTGWLANDSAAVMSTLAPDAVLMPGGLDPIVGDSAIRAYWWPPDGSRTTINDYSIELDEIYGNADLAYLRGRGTIAFTYQDSAGNVSNAETEAVHLSIARRNSAGAWQIARRAWSRVR